MLAFNQELQQNSQEVSRKKKQQGLLALVSFFVSDLLNWSLVIRVLGDAGTENIPPLPTSPPAFMNR
jgi:hypothetical protein